MTAPRWVLRLVVRSVLLVAAFLPGAQASAGRCSNACREVLAECRSKCDSRTCVRLCRERAGCPPGRATIRTLAYVVTECRGAATALLGSRQSLRIRRGDCAPETVVEFSTNAGRSRG